MVNRTYTQSAGGLDIRAYAPGAQSIRIEVQSAPSVIETSESDFRSPMAQIKVSERTFLTWAYVSAAALAASVVLGQAPMLLLSGVTAVIALAISHEIYRQRYGSIESPSPELWCLSPSQWWPIGLDSAPAVIEQAGIVQHQRARALAAPVTKRLSTAALNTNQGRLVGRKG
jgi:hypothetical protein